MTDKVKEYLATIGSKGGKATGKAKVRGGAAYYKSISQKATEARKRKAATPDKSSGLDAPDTREP